MTHPQLTNGEDPMTTGAMSGRAWHGDGSPARAAPTLTAPEQAGECAEVTGQWSACTSCGERYRPAPPGVIHKCGKCSGGICQRVGSGPSESRGTPYPTELVRESVLDEATVAKVREDAIREAIAALPSDDLPKSYFGSWAIRDCHKALEALITPPDPVKALVDEWHGSDEFMAVDYNEDAAEPFLRWAVSHGRIVL